MELNEEQKKKRIAEAQRTLGKASSSRYVPAAFDYAPTPAVPRSLESLYANSSIDVYAGAPVGGLGSEQGSAPQEDTGDRRDRTVAAAGELLDDTSRIAPQADSAVDPGQAAPEQSANEVQPEQVEGVVDDGATGEITPAPQVEAPEDQAFISEPIIASPGVRELNAFTPDSVGYAEPAASAPAIDQPERSDPGQVQPEQVERAAEPAPAKLSVNEAIASAQSRMMNDWQDSLPPEEFQAKVQSFGVPVASTEPAPANEPLPQQAVYEQAMSRATASVQASPAFGPSEVPIASQDSQYTLASVAAAKAPELQTFDTATEPQIEPIADTPSPVSIPQPQSIDAAAFAPDPGDYTEPMVSPPVSDQPAYGAPDMEAIQAGGNRMMARRTDLSHEQKMGYAAKSPKARKSPVASAKTSTTEIPPVGPASDPGATTELPEAGAAVAQDEPLFGPSETPMSQQKVEPAVTADSIASGAPNWAALDDLPKPSAPAPSSAPAEQPSTNRGGPVESTAFSADSPLIQMGEEAVDSASAAVNQVVDLLAKLTFSFASMREQVSALQDRMDHGDDDEFR